MLILRGVSGLNTLGRTTTVTGMLTLPPDDWNSNWPLKLPATSPPPGSAEFTTFTVTFDGAVPLFADTVSHAPPSDVVVTSFQGKAPDPAARTCTDCAGGLAVLGG